MHVIIQRERDGREYQIESGNFKRGKHFLDDDGEMKTFEAAGFEILAGPNGEPYDPPAARSASAPAAAEPKG